MDQPIWFDPNWSHFLYLPTCTSNDQTHSNCHFLLERGNYFPFKEVQVHCSAKVQTLTIMEEYVPMVIVHQSNQGLLRKTLYFKEASYSNAPWGGTHVSGATGMWGWQGYLFQHFRGSSGPASHTRTFPDLVPPGVISLQFSGFPIL